MFPNSFSLGPFTLHFYGLIIAFAAIAGWYIAKGRAHLYKIPLKLFDDPILLLPIVLGIAGARAYHVVDYWEIYSQNLPSIFAVQNGGLGIWGGLAGIFVGLWLVAKIRKISFLSIMDLISPSLILGQAIGRIGNYINQEGFGPPTNLPWGVYIDPINRPLQYQSYTHFHPTFFYEAILDAIFFIILIYIERRFRSSGQLSIACPPKLQRRRVSGQLFAIYLIFYSLGRFIVEFWRIDTARIGSLQISHLLSLVAFMVGVNFLVNTHKKVLDKT